MNYHKSSEINVLLSPSYMRKIDALAHYNLAKGKRHLSRWAEAFL